jgi:sugar phosphate isomerase/epimerase
MFQNKIAVSSADNAPKTAPILLTGDICGNLIHAAGLGYDAIEIHTRENAAINFDEILKTCKDYHIGISAVVSGRLAVQENVSMTDTSMANMEKAMEGMVKYIDIAASLQTDLIIGWIRGKIAQQYSPREYYKIFAENLKQLIPAAQKKNVKLHIECINRYEINSFNSAQETLEFLDTYALENVFVHLDTFHMNIEEADIPKAIAACKDKLGYMHFADSNRWYPGYGHIDFAPIFEAMAKIQYEGYLSVECLPNPTGEEAAKNALKFIKTYFNK